MVQLVAEDRLIPEYPDLVAPITLNPVIFMAFPCRRNTSAPVLLALTIVLSGFPDSDLIVRLDLLILMFSI